MARRVLQASVAFLLILAVGGHWALLQSVAWVGMTINYAKGSSFPDAVRKTFDGQHPCKICRAVEQGKKAEREKLSLKVETKLDFFSVRSAAYLPPSLPFTLLTAADDFADSNANAPPTPPPRFS